MENKDLRISELPPIDSLMGDEILPCAKGNTNGGISVAVLREYINNNVSSGEVNNELQLPVPLKAGYGISISPENEISVTVDTTVFRFVSALPVTGIESKIYLVKDPDHDKSYLEFVYSDEQWVLVGRHNLYADTDNMVSRKEYDQLLDRIEQLEEKLK